MKKWILTFLAVFLAAGIVVFISLPERNETLAHNFQTSHDAIPQDFGVSRPSAGKTIRDARFNNPITRIARPPDFSGRCLIPEYSKRQMFNANESLLRLSDCDGRTHLYDADTYEYRKTLGDPITGAQDIFWHPTDPNLLYFNTGATLFLYNTTTDAVSTVFRFQDGSGQTYLYADTFAEGNLSNDGRTYAVIGRMGDTDFREILVLDLQTGTILSRRDMPGGVDFVDWVSISPNGTYVVVDYATSARGIEVYPRDLSQLLWTRSLGTGHSDLTLDADGTEVLVMDVYDETINQTVFRKYRLSDGQVTDLLAIGLFDQHISCRNFGRPGWCTISVFDMNDDQSTSETHWEPFADEIFILNLDGSAMNATGGVERLAHHHSRRYGVEGVYAAEPHATVSRGGDRIIFGSNWREDIYDEKSINTYVLDLRSGASAGTQPSTPSSPSCAVVAY